MSLGDRMMYRHLSCQGAMVQPLKTPVQWQFLQNLWWNRVLLLGDSFRHPKNMLVDQPTILNIDWWTCINVSKIQPTSTTTTTTTTTGHGWSIVAPDWLLTASYPTKKNISLVRLGMSIRGHHWSSSNDRGDHQDGDQCQCPWAPLWVCLSGVSNYIPLLSKSNILHRELIELNPI